ncbi:hypothetical protein EHS13_12595 [Paenibacillus psychroresistens]|uniref:Uncharacterized protein n=1 Tax=Paenibacillus psychroresistens TaxID=1778678 RepID=A0A6B8RJD2_9BACL|nr:hypothetical protein [Paenibacillus psychroresistens]QGQ95663.1 hypothetical protein EHS13_12595 [Paenibacillus psychroresistens]
MTWKLNHRNGEIYDAGFSLLTRADLPLIRKSEGWSRGLNWSEYFQKNHEYTAYKLHIIGNNINNIIQGLIAIAFREGYVELELTEKAPLNRKPSQQFINAGEVLFAQACLFSLENGGDGYVLLKAKTGLMEYYIDHYGMEVVNSKQRLLAIPPLEAKRLIGLYYI